MPPIELRQPETVMVLDRMGASHPTRLSFMRQLIRRLHADRSVVTRMVWEIDHNGFGRAVYSASLGGRHYSLCAFTAQLADSDRTDRVIAEAWDATFLLYDGIPNEPELQRMRKNAMQQEAGRYHESDLVLSRANKSVRMFEHVVSSLARGRQPDEEMVKRVGYLMRTTAVYGNGKFGLADRSLIAARIGMSGPFQAELLAVWLIRGFTHDLVEYLARCQNSDRAVPLSPQNRRHLGIGNATGLGMAPFLVSHPVLIHHWIAARETALARVCSIEYPTEDTITRFQSVFARAQRHIGEIAVSDPDQSCRNQTLILELNAMLPHITTKNLSTRFAWKKLIELSAGCSLECQEMVVSLVIEPHGELVDSLCDGMASDLEPELEPAASIDELRETFEHSCTWTRDIDFSHPDNDRMFWYVSEEKLEPRRGDRVRDHGVESALPLDVARQYRELDAALSDCISLSVAEFLADWPSLRHVVRRLQAVARYPYAEVRGNLNAVGMRPVDLLRSKLAFFGATNFDPKSDLWTRITLYKGAPCFDSICELNADDWIFPAIG